MVGKASFSVYLITNRSFARDEKLADFLRPIMTAAAPGSLAVQLREKDLPARELAALGESLAALCRPLRVPFLLNDRLDLAKAIGADGVHLTRKSLPAAEARRLWPAGLLGVSTHNEEEVGEAAAGGADFVTFGPIFETPSKRQHGSPTGLPLLQKVARRYAVPVYALGGVNEENAATVLAHGASGLAMIRAILAAPEPSQAALRFIQLVRRQRVRSTR